MEQFLKIKSTLNRCGCSDGSGYSDGSFSGSGYGSGYSSGEIWQIDDKKCYVSKVDNILTALYSIKEKNNIIIMKGFIIQPRNLLDTFVCIKNNILSHGETFRQAIDDLNYKIINNMSIDDIVNDVKLKYDLSSKIPAKELLNIHRAITGACKQGALSWCNEHNINLDNDMFTLSEFIALTKDAYNSNKIIEFKNAII